MGSRPLVDANGKSVGPGVASVLADPRYQPTPEELLTIGCAKAHRAVTYANYDFRNFGRNRGKTGKIT